MKNIIDLTWQVAQNARIGAHYPFSLVQTETPTLVELALVPENYRIVLLF